MKRVGITGETGLIGRHLREMADRSEQWERVPFQRKFFSDPSALSGFLEKCDAVVHLAGLSRHSDGDFLYQTNLELTRSIIQAAAGLKSTPVIFFASTTHIARTLPYHASKRDSQKLLEESGIPTVTLWIPNTYGPGGRPFYNSAVSTFCHLAAEGKIPKKIEDAELKLIYVKDLCKKILSLMDTEKCTRTVEIAHTEEIRLPELWKKLCGWREMTQSPALHSALDRNLWETFQSYKTHSAAKG
ncbi:MAG: GDP-L-fucose synthase [Lentisphaerae bacterium ADurb.Bin242]|nr:MAG: GDP-L-fucose synthase [Lentisphaerae bacterium ADurb.Bin242]